MANLRLHKKTKLLILFMVVAWGSNLCADWNPYKARYSVYRNGKLIGKADIKLERKGDSWSILNEGSGTHGLARILRARNTEYVEGHMVDGRFQPKLFSHHTRVAGIDDRWTAEFDRQNGMVNITAGKKVLPLAIEQQTLDGLSLKLELRRRLRDNDPNMTFYLVDEDEITEQTFRTMPTEQIETSLGCLRTLPVERVRQGSSRYTRAWHAPDLEFITVRMEHGKTNGNNIEMRITELVLNDQMVQPQPGCAAQQNVQAQP